jgi:crotonobetainyl-CoA:carnitine CoA-transferase CaiB-like acyl-CoA transferase
VTIAFEQAWQALGGGGPAAEFLIEDEPVLAARLPVADLATAAVTACVCAAAELAAVRGRPVTGPLRVNAARVATSFTGDRHLRAGDRSFSGFAPESALFPAADGWVRTHANYPHHLARLRAVLGDDIAASIAARPALQVEAEVLAAGGLAFAARTREDWAMSAPGQAVAGLPLVDRHSFPAAVRAPHTLPSGPLLPAAGIRVLDLTRVIAGPVATRALALLGADVLRVDNPGLPELEGQHLDMDLGKRSTLLDLAQRADRAFFEELLDRADVVVTGYRPGALDRFGLSPDALLDRRPDLVIARLSAWGNAGPWADRRGFDSLVQVAGGIALWEGTVDRPGVLPAQALDHGTGYLLAAAVLRALAARITIGGGHVVELALARTAKWLMDLPPRAQVAGREPEPTTVELAGYTLARPAFALPGGPDTWPGPPRPWGADPPAWH